MIDWKYFRGQRSEIRDQRSEVRDQRSEVRGQRSEVRGLPRGYIQNHWGQRSVLGLTRKLWGLLIIEPNIRPTSLFNEINFLCVSLSIYWQSFAKSKDDSVSLFSPSQSVNLLMKCASYLRLAQASRKFKHTEREDLLYPVK